jgi:hypothetical protein
MVSEEMEEIFEYITEKSGDDTYYLKSLNFIEEVDLDIYSSLTEVYPAESIVALLEEINWRPHLVAYTYALASGEHEHLAKFKSALIKGSFVSPQIVVAITIMGKRASGKFLLDLLGSQDVSSKTKGAIVAALPYCLVNEAVLGDNILDLSEFGMGYSIAEHHLKFWRKRNYVNKP